MANETPNSHPETAMDEKLPRTTTRRRFIGATGAAIAGAAATAAIAQQAQQGTPIHSPQHTLPNEQQVGPTNPALDAENPSSVWTLDTDNGTVQPFKYSFSLAHKASNPAAGPARSHSANSRSRRPWPASRCASSPAVSASCTGTSAPSGPT